MKGRITFLIFLVCAAMGTKEGSAHADDISVIRMHLECGWFIQFSSQSSDDVARLTEFHIVNGSSLAADIGITKAELAQEVTEASERAAQGMERSDYVATMEALCSSGIAFN